ncbi:winged helix-turn-helix domain-containing protein [Streptomyces scabiei]|uniref:ArsR/SmtB family transcription factor n=1 Tax=Streptomyces scabiei TaxID=1930 RepID=UPI00298FCFB7|nr:winged helix-turn-helix domain-containing protein [Streptomyces scabiei]MDW8806541.1 winged helix-turn-helix domain-containing protein [Streptomyces scabiei]
MLRIHFTTEDMSTTRLAAEPDVLWEVLLSLHALQKRPGTKEFGLWRDGARGRLLGATADLSRMLCELAPPSGYSADFLTPTAGTSCLDEALDTLLATPRTRLRADLGELAPRRAPAAWLGALAAGDPAVLRTLGEAVRSYHRTALAPYWRSLHAQVEADRAIRLQALATGGVARLLTHLHPQARWQPPVLELPYPVDQDLFLNGRGLVLLPSFFCFGVPITLKNPDTAPVLVYPVVRSPGWAAGGVAPDGPAGRPLTALLGRTRATVMQLLVHASTTGELARRADISAASASQHATVLRQAGLISTRRQGNTVRHMLSPLGAELLNSPRGPH